MIDDVLTDAARRMDKSVEAAKHVASASLRAEESLFVMFIVAVSAHWPMQ